MTMDQNICREQGPGGDEDAPPFPFPRASLVWELPPEFRRMRDRAPVARVTLPGGVPAWLATGHAEVRAVLVDPRFSRAAAARSPGAGVAPNEVFNRSLPGLDDPEHGRLRGLAVRAFTARRVESLRPAILAGIDGLLDRVEELPRPVDLVERLCRPLPVLMICELLGVPPEDREGFASWTYAATASAESVAAMAEGYERLLGYFRDLIGRKRREPGDDLVSALIAARDRDDRLSDDELLGLCAVVLAAGYETTTALFALSVVALLHDRSRWESLREDPERIPAAVEELLRMVPVTEIGGPFPRVALEDVELGGVLIRAGEIVMPVADAANRDPRVFPDPERLDLARRPNPHIALGAGIHRCLGAALTRLEMNLGLRRLVERFPGLRLGVPEAQLRLRPRSVLHTPEVLPVTW
jgi:nocardicin N-oxygenase